MSSDGLSLKRNEKTNERSHRIRGVLPGPISGPEGLCATLYDSAVSVLIDTKVIASALVLLPALQSTRYLVQTLLPLVVIS